MNEKSFSRSDQPQTFEVYVFRGLRFLSHDTGECVASFPLCRWWLNSFKVTETVLPAEQAHQTLAKLTLPRKGGSLEQNTMRTGLGDLKR